MWRCDHCNETVHGSFAVCWNCGTSRDGVANPAFLPADAIPKQALVRPPAPARDLPPVKFHFRFGLNSAVAVMGGLCVALALAKPSAWFELASHMALFFLGAVVVIAAALILTSAVLRSLFATVDCARWIRGSFLEQEPSDEIDRR